MSTRENGVAGRHTSLSLEKVLEIKYQIVHFPYLKTDRARDLSKDTTRMQLWLSSPAVSGVQDLPAMETLQSSTF